MLISAGSVRQLLDRFTGRSRPLPAVPPDQRIYVIGDIHGRADLLTRLQRSIAEDASDGPAVRRVVYLGDYIDRGLNSKEVIDLLLHDPLTDFERVTLKGNHEDAMLKFLADPAAGPGWFAIGGDATAMSYGVRLASDLPAGDRFQHVREELQRLVPESHKAFLSRLALTHQAGDYFMVHAGVRPGVAWPTRRRATSCGFATTFSNPPPTTARSWCTAIRPGPSHRSGPTASGSTPRPSPPMS